MYQMIKANDYVSVVISGKHLVLYDDGDQEWLSLIAERIEWSQNEGANDEASKEEEEVWLHANVSSPTSNLP